MDSEETGFRGLRDALLEYEGSAVLTEVIAPWMRANVAELEWLWSFASRPGSPIPPAEKEDLWQLYALSRVNETLLLPFQSGRADGTDWPGPPITLEDYGTFARAFGLTVTEVPSFSPFFHEIVEVEEAEDEAEPISLLSTDWPCLMLGDLLVSRAGARVRAGRLHLRKEIAEASTLYWAYRRKNRLYEDLSQGWGSNSQ